MKRYFIYVLYWLAWCLTMFEFSKCWLSTDQKTACLSDNSYTSQSSDETNKKYPYNCIRMIFRGGSSNPASTKIIVTSLKQLLSVAKCNKFHACQIDSVHARCFMFRNYRHYWYSSCVVTRALVLRVWNIFCAIMPNSVCVMSNVIDIKVSVLPAKI